MLIFGTGGVIDELGRAEGFLKNASQRIIRVAKTSDPKIGIKNLYFFFCSKREMGILVDKISFNFKIKIN